MIIGLTGGIASGKSTVSKYLAEKGFKVYDADKIAKDISEKKSVQEEIILTFGNKILDKNGNIDRKKLKEIVFENKEKLKELLVNHEVDIITFTSSSTVFNLVDQLDGKTGLLDGVSLACIGPITADACRKYGLEPQIISDTFTIDGLTEAIVKGVAKE